jgi:hypothetical protein
MLILPGLKGGFSQLTWNWVFTGLPCESMVRDLRGG